MSGSCQEMIVIDAPGGLLVRRCTRGEFHPGRCKHRGSPALTKSQQQTVAILIARGKAA